MSMESSDPDWSWILGLVGLAVALGIFGYVKRQPSETTSWWIWPSRSTMGPWPS
jgi:hypothetical protein